jgi:hypothetical protein
MWEASVDPRYVLAQLEVCHDVGHGRLRNRHVYEHGGPRPRIWIRDPDEVGDSSASCDGISPILEIDKWATTLPKKFKNLFVGRRGEVKTLRIRLRPTLLKLRPSGPRRVQPDAGAVQRPTRPCPRPAEPYAPLSPAGDSAAGTDSLSP